LVHDPRTISRTVFENRNTVWVPAIFGSFCIPTGLFIFAWTARNSVQEQTLRIGRGEKKAGGGKQRVLTNHSKAAFCTHTIRRDQSVMRLK
jgi:hypothetical protein